MRVIVTGSREWDHWHLIRLAIEALPPHAVVVEGGARGVDQAAGDLADALGLAHEVFLADWSKLGKAAGPMRNQAMLDAGADLVLAFPLADSVGTWDMVRRAEKAGIEVRVFRIPEEEEGKEWDRDAYNDYLSQPES